jgi:hypothetical protein
MVAFSGKGILGLNSDDIQVPCTWQIRETLVNHEARDNKRQSPGNAESYKSMRTMVRYVDNVAIDHVNNLPLAVRGAMG